MKINMWLIAEKLADFEPKCDIRQGGNSIDGIRFLSENEEKIIENRYVYLCEENEDREITLINGADIIFIQNQDRESVLNRLLDIFEFFNQWESALWELSSRGSVQQVLDKGEEVLKNPMILAAQDGSVLAMTSKYVSQDLNENWVICRNTRRVPMHVFGMPLYTAQRQKTEFKEIPQILYLPNHKKTMGCVFVDAGNELAFLSLWEHETLVSTGHLQVMKVLCDVLLAMLRGHAHSMELRGRTSILFDLLSGIRIQDELLQKLEIKCEKPWCILTVQNVSRATEVSRKSLVQSMILTGIACIPVIFETHVVCLTAENRVKDIINRIFGREEWKYYTVVASMPFEELSDIRVRYQQNLYCEEENKNLPGFYDAKTTALSFVFSKFPEDSKRMVHPAVAWLKKYDRENSTDLYRTLYYYLYFEKSIQKGAEAIHIHRNSFLYRIKKIQDMCGLDFEDAEERNFLLVSFLMDRQEKD